MVNNRLITATLAVVWSATSLSGGAELVNIDPEANIQWLTGSTYVQGVEMHINDELKVTRQMSDSISHKSFTMANLAEMTKAVMADCDDFGENSVFYELIVKEMEAIVVADKELIKVVGERPWFNSAAVLTKGWQITVKGAHLVNDFCNIVNNGKIKNPFKVEGISFASDGGNYMQREKRLKLALTILTGLREIRRELQTLVICCRYWGAMDLWMDLDYGGWARMINMAYNAKYAIRIWNQTFNRE